VPPASIPNSAEPSAPSTASAATAQSSTDPTQAQSTAPDSAAPSASGSAPAAGTTPAQPSPVPAPTNAAAKAPLATEPDAGKSNNSQPSDGKKDTSSSNAEVPGEDGAIVLSSKGAENRLVHSVPPQYPDEARSGQAQGTVVLKASVNENGAVAALHPVEGNPTLVTAAITAVRQYRYRPYIRDGKALPFQTIVVVDFQRP
jgi:TonB family protein